MPGQKNLDKITSDLLKPIMFNLNFKIWMGFLTISLLVCLYAYTLQLKTGLGVAGIRDYASWGMYIANFVFFVACSLIGMLISAVLGLLGIKWAAPITRIAEIIALAFAAVAGLIIISDMVLSNLICTSIPVFICALRYAPPISTTHADLPSCAAIVNTVNTTLVDTVGEDKSS